MICHFATEAQESSHCCVIKILRAQRALLPRLVDVLEDEEGLADHSAPMDEDGDSLVNRVEPQKQGALVEDVFLDVVVGYALELQRPLDPPHEGADPEPQELYFFSVRHSSVSGDDWFFL